MRTNLYSQNRHVMIVDGVPLEGLGEGDWLTIDDDGNAATRTLGGDGPGMNISTYQGGKVTFNLQPVSPVLGVFYALRDEQQSNPRLISIVIMSGVAEVIRISGAAFGKLPSFATGGPAQKDRSFEMEYLKLKLDSSAVEQIAGGILGF